MPTRVNHAADLSRRHSTVFAKMFKNVNILEFGDDIRIHHEKCIEISTNMPSIGLEISEIAFEISEFLRKSKNVAWQI